jgi:hypothetical protein
MFDPYDVLERQASYLREAPRSRDPWTAALRVQRTLRPAIVATDRDGRAHEIVATLSILERHANELAPSVRLRHAV